MLMSLELSAESVLSSMRSVMSKKVSEANQSATVPQSHVWKNT